MAYLGTNNWNDIITNDLFIVSYSYNERKPRFYSKWFIKNDPGIYSVDIPTAVASSSSAPFYFQPNTYRNGFNITETLIDGGLIANDPAYYAYEAQKNLKGCNKIRVVSIGTGLTDAQQGNIITKDS